MTTRHLSVRLEAEAFARLDRESRRSGQTRSQLAKTLLDEGLRMAVHPGIVFRGGPAGRRPGIAGGPDVWEIVRVFRDLEARGDEAVAQTAQLTGLSPSQIQIALGYYADYSDEIDRWIQWVDDEAEQAEAAWQRARRLLQR